MLATSLKFAIKTGITTRQAVSSASCCSKCLRYKGDLAVESMLDGILEVQVHEVEEARNLYRRCESADQDGAGAMAVDTSLQGGA